MWLKRRYSYIHVPKKKQPHLLGHGSEWRKCFVVHPDPQSKRPLESYQWLTGSVLEEGLPTCLPPVKTGAEELKLLEERLQAAVGEQGVGWLKGRKGMGKLRSVLSSALLGVWMSGADHLRSASLTRDPRIESFWRSDGNKFHCVTNPLFVLHSTQPLALFSDPAHSYEPLPSAVSNPRHIGLFQHSFDQITPFAGSQRFSPTGSAHTVFSANLQTRNQEQTISHGLVQLFGLSSAECVQNGYPLDADLPHPLSLQAVVATGLELTFLAFQLNTLALKSCESGRRNVLWVGPTLELFSEGQVNRKCSELLWQFVMHAPNRKRPALSGFGLKSASL